MVLLVYVPAPHLDEVALQVHQVRVRRAEQPTTWEHTSSSSSNNNHSNINTHTHTRVHKAHTHARFLSITNVEIVTKQIVPKKLKKKKHAPIKIVGTTKKTVYELVNESKWKKQARLLCSSRENKRRFS